MQVCVSVTRGRYGANKVSARPWKLIGCSSHMTWMQHRPENITFAFPSSRVWELWRDSLMKKKWFLLECLHISGVEELHFTQRQLFLVLFDCVVICLRGHDGTAVPRYSSPLSHVSAPPPHFFADGRRARWKLALLTHTRDGPRRVTAHTQTWLQVVVFLWRLLTVLFVSYFGCLWFGCSF